MNFIEDSPDYPRIDPDKISKADMRLIAEHINRYVECLERVMIIPPEILKRDRERIADAIMETKKLIKKLKKGDRSVFKTVDEWEDVI